MYLFGKACRFNQNWLPGMALALAWVVCGKLLIFLGRVIYWLSRRAGASPGSDIIYWQDRLLRVPPDNRFLAEIRKHSSHRQHGPLDHPI